MIASTASARIESRRNRHSSIPDLFIIISSSIHDLVLPIYGYITNVARMRLISPSFTLGKRWYMVNHLTITKLKIESPRNSRRSLWLRRCGGQRQVDKIGIIKLIAKSTIVYQLENSYSLDMPIDRLMNPTDAIKTHAVGIHVGSTLSNHVRIRNWSK